MTTGECVFCAIVNRKAPAKIIERGTGHVIFEPLNPHAPGHVLVVPAEHIENASENPALAGVMASIAAIHMAKTPGLEYNLLTSVGRFATQTVMHLHWHIIPRDSYDELHPDWPWCREEKP
jgi:histidine triad (HIT) family protein